jgi:TPR repeat protein
MQQDEVEAVKWFRKAAEQNHASSQYNLAVCYAMGQGVAKDKVEAYKWCLLAAARGNKNASNALTTIQNGVVQECSGRF